MEVVVADFMALRDGKDSGRYRVRTGFLGKLILQKEIRFLYGSSNPYADKKKMTRVFKWQDCDIKDLGKNFFIKAEK